MSKYETAADTAQFAFSELAASLQDDLDNNPEEAEHLERKIAALEKWEGPVARLLENLGVIADVLGYGSAELQDARQYVETDEEANSIDAKITAINNALGLLRQAQGSDQ